MLTCGTVQAGWFGGVLWFVLWGPSLEVSMIAQIILLLFVPMQGLVGNCLEEALSWVYGTFLCCCSKVLDSAAALCQLMCRGYGHQLVCRLPCHEEGTVGPQQEWLAMHAMPIQADLCPSSEMDRKRRPVGALC